METKTKLAVTSTSFKDGQTIPDTAVFDGFGCTGGNRSPQLSWSGAPAGTKSFAITIWDPDAPTGVGFVHWVLFDIPATTTSLPEGAGAKSDAGVGGIHGTTDFGTQAYGGPCPPPGHGPHHYHFELFALDKLLPMEPDAPLPELLNALKGNTIAKADLVGVYEAPTSQ